ncbi:MAG: AGE family epimerase/isomerase [Lachnospiraceae bacterium]|nr:AGE family epimerase/isomerase [Lachnospiraceae bacterium]
MVEEIKKHLEESLIPFWKNLKDEEYGGYYGYLDYQLKLDKKAVKGCILNSRILWFFSNAFMVLKDESLLKEADHAFRFMKEHCMDRECGGVYWSLTYDGQPEDSTKHTYNQAFAIYALSSYYDASGNQEALDMAWDLYHIIETKCRDEQGYLEAFDRNFQPEDNDKLSENGVMADRTMNTLLHVLEAYTELYRVTEDERVGSNLRFMLDVVADKIYNPVLRRQEVFFDSEYHTLLDLHSYGHDIETAWLVDRCIDVLNDDAYRAKITPITMALTDQIYKTAFTGRNLSNECEKGKVDTNCVWWVQAEAIVGFINGYQHDSSRTEYLQAAASIWEFIKEFIIDKRNGSEWFWLVDRDGNPYSDKPIVEPWKCPYHNGRMCMEVIRRNIDA